MECALHAQTHSCWSAANDLVPNRPMDSILELPKKGFISVTYFRALLTICKLPFITINVITLMFHQCFLSSISHCAFANGALTTMLTYFFGYGISVCLCVCLVKSLLLPGIALTLKWE